ncbi:hypothetical protein N7475_006749 [Penicillium sp. IBT 31633x]|nr:hypothetical protein N7475_006749 [Penicillium sp. IBT 31633x]
MTTHDKRSPNPGAEINFSVQRSAKRASKLKATTLPHKKLYRTISITPIIRPGCEKFAAEFEPSPLRREPLETLDAVWHPVLAKWP